MPSIPYDTTHIMTDAISTPSTQATNAFLNGMCRSAATRRYAYKKYKSPEAVFLYLRFILFHLGSEPARYFPRMLSALKENDYPLDKEQHKRYGEQVSYDA